MYQGFDSNHVCDQWRAVHSAQPISVSHHANSQYSLGSCTGRANKVTIQVPLRLCIYSVCIYTTPIIKLSTFTTPIIKLSAFNIL